ncbi:MAG: hypothetical protein GY811_06860 [Myxococcales bacterium]|nr:hypothetical protein [Myxococcales bacterium]
MRVYKPRSPRGTVLLGHALLGLVLASCNGSPAKSNSATKSPEPTSPSNALHATTSEDWTRAEWLRAADGFLAKPETMPRLNNPASRPLFEKLITTDAWLNHDWRIFEGDGAADLMRFFPTIKKLTMTFMSLNAIDEIVALSLNNLDVYRAFIHSGTDFIARLPAGDATKSNRQAGLDKVRLGAAIGVCGLLYLVIDASDEFQAAAFDRLAQPSSYSFHSREGLQLILATLDGLIKSGSSGLRTRYKSARSVIAAEYGKRGESASSRRVTYQGLGRAALDLSKLETVVSTTGKFSVELGPGGLASRVELDQPDGSTSVQHRIELQHGDSRFEAVCLDGQTEEALAAQFMQMGLVAEESEQAGRWLVLNNPDKHVRMRVLSIAGRGCVASVEGPAGQVPPARIESFLVSLRAAL